MADWLSTPLIVTASLAVIIAAVKVIRWTATVDLRLDQFTAFAKEVRDDIKQIFLRLPPVPVVSSSPLQLTDLGEENSARLGADGGSTQCAAAPLPIPPRIGHRHAVDYGSRSTVKGGLTVSREAP